MCSKIILLLLILPILYSCSEGPKESSPATFNISVGSLTSQLNTDIALGGAFLVAKQQGGLTLGRVLEASGTDSYNETFPNGTWNFHVFTWEGGITSKGSADGSFTGVVRCGSTGDVSLAGDPVVLDIFVTNAACDDSKYRGSVPAHLAATPAGSTLLSASFKKFRGPKLQTCRNLDSVVGVGYDCEYDPLHATPKDLKGYANSYRYVLQGFDLNPGQAPIYRGNSLISGCMRVEESAPTGAISGSSALASNNVGLPNQTAFPIALRLRAYFKAKGLDGTMFDCDSSAGEKDFPLMNGTFTQASLADGQKIVKSIFDGGISNLPADDLATLFVRTNELDVCQSPRLAASSFAGGNGNAGHPWLVCNYNQLVFLANQFTSQASIRNGSFKLLQNINLWYGLTSASLPSFIFNDFPMIGDSVTTPATAAASVAFEGVFDGGGKTFVGMHIPESINAIDIEGQAGFIRNIGAAGSLINLTLAGVDLETKKSHATGAMAGRSEGLIKNVKVKGGFVSGADHVGGVVGILDPGGRVISSTTHDVEVQGDNVIGGLAGAFYPGALAASQIDKTGVYKGKVHLRSSFAPSCVNTGKTSATCATSSAAVNAYWEGGQCRKPFDGCAGWTVGPGSAYCFKAMPAQNCDLKWENEYCVVKADFKESTCIFASAKWIAPQTAGGLVGYLAGTANSDCTARATPDISYSVASTLVEGDSILGGLVGYIRTNCKIENSYTTSMVAASNPSTDAAGYRARAGGIAGKALVPLLTKVFHSKGSVFGIGSEANPAIGLDFGPANCTDVFATDSGNGGALCSTLKDYNNSRGFGVWTNWVQDDPADIPRLSWEAKRFCNNRFGTITRLDATLTSPYVICDATQFGQINASSDSFILGDTIDFHQIAIPAGVPYITNFSGTLDGHKHFLTNYSVSAATASEIALIKTIKPIATVKNLNIFDFSIETASNFECYAPLAVLNEGIIKDVKAHSKITAQDKIAGLVCSNTNIIDNVRVTSQLTTLATDHGMELGGIAANNSGTIKRSYANASIEFSNAGKNFLYAGGLVGINTGLIEESESNSNVLINDSTVVVQQMGGIAGTSTGQVRNVVSHMRIEDISESGGAPLTTYFGGIVGINTGTIENALSDLSIVGLPPVAGNFFYTIADDGTITNSYYIDNKVLPKFVAPWNDTDLPYRVWTTTGTNTLSDLYAPNIATYVGWSISADDDSDSIWKTDSSEMRGPWLRNLDHGQDEMYALILSWANFN